MNNKPRRCPICGYFLTIEVEFTGCRCIDPGHWQAAGVLTSRDYLPMAQLASNATPEQNRRGNGPNASKSGCCEGPKI